LKMIPEPVMIECRQRAREMMAGQKPTSWTGAAIVVGIWILSALLVVMIIVR
jgi:hypothetical protein